MSEHAIADEGWKQQNGVMLEYVWMKAPSEMYYLVGGGVEVGQRPAKGKAVVSQVGLEVRLRVNQMDWKGL